MSVSTGGTLQSKPTVKKPQETSHNIRPDSSFKIKDSLRQASQTEPVVKKQSVVEKQMKMEVREGIDEVKVAAALEKYLTDHRPEATVAVALTTHRPVVEGEDIQVLVDNQLQLEKLEALKAYLKNALMKSLNNGFITLRFKLFDTNNSVEEKKLFTASEKFEHFLKINPVIGDLKNIFGLEID